MGYSVTGVFDMVIFSRFADAVAMLPDWLSLLGSPVLFLLLAAGFFVCRREHWVRPCWLACAVAGFLLVCCEGELRDAFLWTGCFAAEYLLVRLAAYIGTRFRRRSKKTRADRIYEKFHVGLEAAEETPIPKVTCFPQAEEPDASRDAGECGIRFSHVLSVLERLRAARLSPPDRLEADMVARRVESFRGRQLNAEETDILNDCLASLLRLSAKYSL